MPKQVKLAIERLTEGRWQQAAVELKNNDVIRCGATQRVVMDGQTQHQGAVHISYCGKEGCWVNPQPDRIIMDESEAVELLKQKLPPFGLEYRYLIDQRLVRNGWWISFRAANGCGEYEYAFVVADDGDLQQAGVLGQAVRG